eukprot:TRINITY_DN111149_c0_g1_i1.p1 TRINITY_DN111149_c0_g1~~TRINITY_DN111149_c0_g1_i1.p1  ORF type:complete len:220 (+),score=42.68 TRINITY_DN111149_c0_g1_i1:89-748(+)
MAPYPATHGRKAAIRQSCALGLVGLVALRVSGFWSCAFVPLLQSGSGAVVRSHRAERQCSLVTRRAALPGKFKGNSVFVPTNIRNKEDGEIITIQRHLGPDSNVGVMMARLPLGLQIAAEGSMTGGNVFVVEAILPGGCVAEMGLGIKEGDVIHAITTDGGEDGKKTVKLSRNFANADEMREGMVGNSDERIALVIETEATGDDSGLGFLVSQGMLFSR